MHTKLHKKWMVTLCNNSVICDIVDKCVTADTTVQQIPDV